eukprot:3816310-Lingulodinium_polyedra.AAC.1
MMTMIMDVDEGQALHDLLHCISPGVRAYTPDPPAHHLGGKQTSAKARNQHARCVGPGTTELNQHEPKHYRAQS